MTLQQGPCCTEVWQERDWGCRVSMVTASHSPSPGTRHMGEKPKPGGPSPVTNLSQLGRGCGTDSPRNKIADPRQLPAQEPSSVSLGLALWKERWATSPATLQ